MFSVKSTAVKRTIIFYTLNISTQKMVRGLQAVAVKLFEHTIKRYKVGV